MVGFLTDSDNDKPLTPHSEQNEELFKELDRYIKSLRRTIKLALESMEHLETHKPLLSHYANSLGSALGELMGTLEKTSVAFPAGSFIEIEEEEDEEE